MDHFQSHNKLLEAAHGAGVGNVPGLETKALAGMRHTLYIGPTIVHIEYVQSTRTSSVHKSVAHVVAGVLAYDNRPT